MLSTGLHRNMPAPEHVNGIHRFPLSLPDGDLYTCIGFPTQLFVLKRQSTSPCPLLPSTQETDWTEKGLQELSAEEQTPLLIFFFSSNLRMPSTWRIQFTSNEKSQVFCFPSQEVIREF